MSTDKNTSIGKSFGTDVFKEIKKMPTAYNVDKVIEELEKRKQEYLDGFGVHQDNELYGVACGLGDAIEIVKQGGVSDASDNVCEWIKVNGNACKCYTHAEIYDSRVLDWCVCPYCKKKIKIVGD